MYHAHDTFRRTTAPTRFLAVVEDPNYGITTGMKLAEVEKIFILETLKIHRFNRTRAARVLGIGIRTLQRKLNQYKIDQPELASI
jgi:DNA-binding NtrC family response regulator